MFYYSNWYNFCKRIKDTQFKIVRADESISEHKDAKFIVLKHDVEDNVAKALRLAEIEHILGINGSYYVQAYLLKNPKNVIMLRKMRDMGHEISYHYDVLDANSGDFDNAEKDFAKWINIFRKEGFAFKTICQHGNPVKERIGYRSNRDFFRNKNVKSHYPDMVDMVVDYSRYVNQPYKYISDAGYMWKYITEPETNDLNPDADIIPIGNFSKLIDFIEQSDCSIIISTHPHRWVESKVKINAKIVVFKIIRATALTMQKIPLAKKLMNHFYFLAKKI